MSNQEIIKMLFEDTVDVIELQGLISSKWPNLRFYALMALGRWITSHPSLQLNAEFIEVLAKIASSETPEDNRIWSGTGVNAKMLAIGCLHDVKLQEAKVALERVYAYLNHSEKERISEFLEERKNIELYTGHKN